MKLKWIHRLLLMTMYNQINLLHIIVGKGVRQRANPQQLIMDRNCVMGNGVRQRANPQQIIMDRNCVALIIIKVCNLDFITIIFIKYINRFQCNCA